MPASPGVEPHIPATRTAPGGRSGDAPPARPGAASGTAAGAGPHGRALLCLHGAVALFGVAGLFGKWVTLHPVVIVAARAAVAALVFAVLLRVLSRGAGRHAGGAADAAGGQGAAPGLPARELAWLWAGGAVLALHWAAFFQAIQVSTVAVGVLAYATAPVFAALLEPVWFRERFSAAGLVGALVTVAGVALIVPRWSLAAATGDGVLAGVLWGVLSGLSFAVLSMLNRRLARRHGALRVAFHQDAAAALLLAPLLPWVWSAPGADGWLRALLLLAVLGVVCTALAHALFIASLRVLTAHAAAIGGALEPVYGIALAWLLLGEQPAARTLAGGALILAAVLWATRRRPDAPWRA